MPNERDYREREIGHRAGDFTLKKPFESKHRAKVFLKRARGLSGRGNLKPYECVVCSQWHVGNQPR